MSKREPASPAWAIYYQVHPDVAATWGESNGREPNCDCARCLAALGLQPCAGVGQSWQSRNGRAACPECGALVGAVAPLRARTGGWLGTVPRHRSAAVVQAPAPPLPGTVDVVGDL